MIQTNRQKFYIVHKLRQRVYHMLTEWVGLHHMICYQKLVQLGTCWGQGMVCRYRYLLTCIPLSRGLLVFSVVRSIGSHEKGAPVVKNLEKSQDVQCKALLMLKRRSKEKVSFHAKILISSNKIRWSHAP